MKESTIEKKVCDYALSIGYTFQAKFKSLNNRAVPDRLFITPGGVTIYIEFKREGKSLTGAQDRKAIQIGRPVTPVFECDTVESGKHILDVCRAFRISRLTSRS